jgi:RHS repeat-associated protein
MDGRLIFDKIAINPTIAFTPALSFAVGHASAKGVQIDNIDVRLGDNRLFKEDFEKYHNGKLPESTGWYTSHFGNTSNTQSNNHFRVSISGGYARGKRYLALKPELGSNTVIIKGFNLPVNTIFDVSDNLFEIRYNRSMNPSYEFNGTKFGHGPYGLGQYFPTTSAYTMNSKPVSGQMTSTMTDTYYIYSHDGKLMAEYDHNGNGVRDYIYMGSRLIAEYNVQTGKYYYYMSDQINSTRIVTDDTGNIVHSSAHGPYGEIQKTWTNTYDPKLKFSGKEREAYSGLDYFGARHYDHNRYRFISVDPIINKAEALVNPQLWNLYAYSKNNPITYYDPDGRLAFSAFIYGFIKFGIPVLAAALAIDPLQKTIQKIQDSGGISIEGDFKTKRDMISDSMKGMFTSHNENVKEKKKTRSKHPIGKRRTYNSKKGAREAAQKAGKKNKAVHHPQGEHGPHYHPGDEKGNPLNHDHYNYSKRKK